MWAVIVIPTVPTCKQHTIDQRFTTMRSNGLNYCIFFTVTTRQQTGAGSELVATAKAMSASWCLSVSTIFNTPTFIPLKFARKPVHLFALFHLLPEYYSLWNVLYLSRSGRQCLHAWEGSKSSKHYIREKAREQV